MKKSAPQGKAYVHDKIVADAGVALKWFLQKKEDHCDEAIALLMNYSLIQPPHFLEEVVAVLARKKPDEADQDLADLLEVNMTVADEPAIFSINPNYLIVGLNKYSVHAING